MRLTKWTYVWSSLPAPHLPSSQTSKTPSFPLILPTSVPYLKPVLPGGHVDSAEICEVDKLCISVILEERNDGNNSLGVNHNVQLIVVQYLNISYIFENINSIQKLGIFKSAL